MANSAGIVVPISIVLATVLLSLITQCSCDSFKKESSFHEQLDLILPDDKDLKETISTYLEKVPSSHQSRTHASRCILMNLFRRFSHSSFEQHTSDSGLSKLHHIPKPLPGPQPTTSPVGPPPITGPPASTGKPMTTGKPTTSKKPRTTKSPLPTSKPMTTSKSNSTVAINDLMITTVNTTITPSAHGFNEAFDNNLKALIAVIFTKAEAACETKCSCTREQTCPQCPPPPNCKECPPCPAPNHCLPVCEGNCPPQPKCPKCPNDASSTPKPTNTPLPSTGKPKTTKASKTTLKPTRRSTVRPKPTKKVSSIKPNTVVETSTKPPIVKLGSTTKTPKCNSGCDGIGLAYRNYSSETSTNTTTTTTTTTKTTTVSGVYLFNKNMESMIKDEKLRDQIHNIINMTPCKAGGEEAKLATKILSKFGESPPHLKSEKRGHGRSVTVATAANNIKALIGHLLESYREMKCKCKCKSTKKACPPLTCSGVCPPEEKPKNCAPCPKNPPCPAPKGCPSYPPLQCNQCQCEYDDEDPVDPITDVELTRKIECKGPACGLQTCGSADLNPLTPKVKNSSTGYMVGGEDQIYGEWPSFARLTIKSQVGPNAGDTVDGLCGGVLISDRHVLTAGHCVNIPKPGKEKEYVRVEAKDLSVTLGEDRRSQPDKFEVQRKVSNVCFSSKFNDPKGEGSRYDFSVLTLDKPVTFNDHIQPACLPREPLQKKAKCFVVGLGITKYDAMGGNHQYSERVQKMQLTPASCKSWGFRDNDRSRHCWTKALAKGDTCGGDSGGPILCLSRRRWTVHGLVSYGSESCDGSESTGWVAVYTRVRAILNTVTSDCKI